MKTSLFLFGAVLALVAGGASAKPAPWYKWLSKANGPPACSQTPLGPGWERGAGPYRDSRCEKLIVVK